MPPRNHPDRIQIAFEDHRLVNNAGLILSAALAMPLGLPQLVDRHLGRASERANPSDKIMALVASTLAGETGPTTTTCCAPAGWTAPSAA